MNPIQDRRHFLFAALAATPLGVVQAQPAGSNMTPNTSAGPNTTGTPNPNQALKLMIVGRRKPGTTLTEHRHHIRQVHGELVVKYIQTEPAVAPQRYAQHQVFDGQFLAAAPGTHPFALNRDFVTQVWFADMNAMARSRETAFYRDHLRGDEDNFVDQATVVFLPVREREVWLRSAAAAAAASASDTSGSTPAASTATKLFYFVQRAPGVDADAFRRGWSALAGQLKGTPAGARIQRHVQNDVLPPPNATPPADGVDEFWVDDESAARSLLTAWQASVRDALVRPGLAVAATQLGLLAREELIHAGTR